MPHYIKKRSNPQVGTYYVGMGEMKVKDAKAYETSLYGNNEMLRFDSQDAYEQELDTLRIAGESVTR